jgi:hypothetical protein
MGKSEAPLRREYVRRALRTGLQVFAAYGMAEFHYVRAKVFGVFQFCAPV